MHIEDAVGGAGSVAGVTDLGPLAWVLDELRKSLEVANKALKRYVRDAEAARGTDLGSVDASQLRIVCSARTSLERKRVDAVPAARSSAASCAPTSNSRFCM